MKFLSRLRLPLLSAAPTTEGIEGELAYHGGKAHLRGPSTWRPLTDELDVYARLYQQGMLGGGDLTCTSTRQVKWTDRFVAMAPGRGPHWNTVGYFEIGFPLNGTIVPGVGGHGDTTVANGYIAMGDWDVLYYVPPATNVAGSQSGNFRIMRFNSPTEFAVPSNWIMVCAQDGTRPGSCRWGDGRFTTATQGPLQRTMAFAQLNNDQTTTFTNTGIDVPNLTATLNTPEGQRIMISGVVQFKAATGDFARVHVQEGATTIATSGVEPGAGVSIGVRAFATAILTPTPGTHTYKITIQRRLGTGTPSLEASATDPAYLLIEAI